ncbi:MAG: glycosyltransferase family 2 protein [Candidatus Doudnabacteria bacterium]|nr:glycosyltransferase family 2 protein [Candidatus Doudnabacteria bacterium]
MPKLTVVIPTYNRARTLGRAIDSVLTQDYKDIQVLVVDDGSTDNTQKVLSEYEDVSNLAYIQLSSPASGTASVGRNIGLACTNTELISFLDSDDELVQSKFSKQVDRMLADQEKLSNLPVILQNQTTYKMHTEIDICYTQLEIVNTDGTISPSGDVISSFFGFYPNVVIPNMKNNIGTNFTTALARKEVFRLLGGFKVVPIGEDAEFKERAFIFGCNESFINEGLYRYYLGSDNSLMQNAKEVSESEKAAKEAADAEYANTKREMRLCRTEQEFIEKFSVPVSISTIKVMKVHNPNILELDSKIPMTEETCRLLEKEIIKGK